MMKALKINFGGAGKVSVDWGRTVAGMEAVGQRAAVAVMTQAGSDKFLPSRGTEVTRTLLSYGVFDLMEMQHTLNFGSLKARKDMRDYELPGRAAEDSVSAIGMVLMGVDNNVANVGVVVQNLAGQKTREITQIS